MSKQNAKKAPIKKNGYKMPDPIPNGEILQDISKKKWILGPSIGVGGFGEIYSAAEYKDRKPSEYPYVVKIEPHGNGPLFVEMHFYMRNAKQDDIETWRAKKKLKTLGMPSYISSGSHECKGTKYRFVVMERFGKDLWNLFLENNRCFPVGTVFQIAIQMLDVLEYIHSKGYVHADLKGANLLLGLSKSTQNQVYLVDFGLAAHYNTKEYKTDPRKAHNGTIEYTSRDAHAGVPTRRGDLEILAYNIIHWLGCTLPWENCLSNPIGVHSEKIKFMDNVDKSLSSCFKNKHLPEEIKEFITYVSKMQHNTEPDYAKCRSILKSGLESCGYSINGPLLFTHKTKSPKRKSDNVRNANSDTPEKKRKVIKKRTTKKTKDINEEESDAEISTENEDNDENEHPGHKIKRKIKKNTRLSENDSDNEEPLLNGFTAEMLRVKKKMEENKKAKTRSKKTVLKSTSSSASHKSSIDLSDNDVIDDTPPPPFKKKVLHKKAVGRNQDTEGISPVQRGGRSKKPVFYGETN